MEARYLFEWLRNGLDVNFSSKSWRDLVKTLIVKILRICQYIIWSGFITDLVNNSQVLRRISFLNQWTNFQFCSQLGKTKNPSYIYEATSSKTQGRGKTGLVPNRYEAVF